MKAQFELDVMKLCVRVAIGETRGATVSPGQVMANLAAIEARHGRKPGEAAAYIDQLHAELGIDPASNVIPFRPAPCRYVITYSFPSQAPAGHEIYYWCQGLPLPPGVKSMAWHHDLSLAYEFTDADLFDNFKKVMESEYAISPKFLAMVPVRGAA